MQHAESARTLAYEIRHADDARQALEAARRSLEVRGATVDQLRSEAAKAVAARAIALEVAELERMDAALHELEVRVAEAIEGGDDIYSLRPLPSETNN